MVAIEQTAAEGGDLVQPEENKAIVRRWYEDLFNPGNLDVADEIITQDHVHHDPTPPDLPPGPEGQRQLASLYRNAFPDAHTTVEDQLAEGDKVVTRWTARGTHRGELMGVPPSGNRVEISGIAIYRVSGGKVEETWSNYDALGIMQQIGAVPQ
jgi:steroid delta-isomerase-like uncharacterized protein